MNESILSTASTAQPTLARVVANVVDLQQQLLGNYSKINASLESLKLEHQISIQNLREDFKRMEDRSIKRAEESEVSHTKEVDRLLEVIKSLIAREPAAPPPRPAQMTYNAAASPASFFNGPPTMDPQMMQRILQAQAMQQQQQQAAMQMHHQAQVALQAQGGQMTSGFQPQQAGQSPMLIPKAAVSTIPAQMPLPSVPAQVMAPKTVVSLPVAEIKTPVTDKSKTTGIFSGSTVAATSTPTPTVTSSFGAQSPSPAISFGGFGQTPKSSIPAVPSPLVKAPLTFGKPEVQLKDENDDDDKVEEFEPDADFKPVIPLPDLVEVVTGEEDEEVLFEEKSKLYRFAETKEWKERGIGLMKILKNKLSGKYRVVMRREQVHKVCANHQLSAGMTIQKMGKNEKAVVWTCADFSEGEQSLEKFSAKFSSPEIADKFIDCFREGVVISEKFGTPEKNAVANLEPEKNAVANLEPKKEVTPVTDAKPAEGFGDKFKLKDGEWDCSGCYLRQAADKTKCDICATNKDGTQGEKNIFAQTCKPTTGGASKFSFGFAAASAAKEEHSAASAAKPSAGFGSSIGGASPTASGIFGGSKAAESETPKPSVFSFAPKKDVTSGISTPVAFSFKGACPESTSTLSSPFGGSGKLMFGNSSTKKEALPTEEKEELEKPAPAATQSIFGSNFSKGLSFASVAQTSKSIFEGEAAEKAKAQFASLAKSKPLATEKNDHEDDEEGAAEEEYEPDVDFKPVCPLPDLIEVKTGEEGETVVFKSRAKLFRFAQETKENKERGLGDIKILKNDKTGKYRAVMRREQTHKLCANFNITPDIKINVKPNTPNIYQFICMDFAENESGVQEIFTIKFKTEELANEFYNAFVTAQNPQ